MPLAPYCLLAGVVALVGSALLVLAARLGAVALGLPLEFAPGSKTLPTFANVAAVVFIAPVVETGLLVALLWFLRRLGLVPQATCIAAAVIWALAHGLFAPVRFFGSLWSFVVYGAGYLQWRQKSRAQGFMAAAGPHIVVNSAAMAAAFLGGA